MTLISKLNESNIPKITDAIRDADIARLMGNPDWRDVFKKHADRTVSPSGKKILRLLYKHATPEALAEID